jgi:hypothetical protein
MDQYRTRVLPPNEWYRLGLPSDQLPADPSTAVIIVVEAPSGAIVGRWMAYNTVVLEGLFIDEAHRYRPGVAGQLLQAMVAELADRDVPMAMTLIQSAEVARLAERHGLTPIEGGVWILDLRPVLSALTRPLPEPLHADHVDISER